MNYMKITGSTVYVYRHQPEDAALYYLYYL